MIFPVLIVAFIALVIIAVMILVELQISEIERTHDEYHRSLMRLCESLRVASLSLIKQRLIEDCEGLQTVGYTTITERNKLVELYGTYERLGGKLNTDVYTTAMNLPVVGQNIDTTI